MTLWREERAACSVAVVGVWLDAKRYVEEFGRFGTEECVLIGIFIHVSRLSGFSGFPGLPPATPRHYRGGSIPNSCGDWGRFCDGGSSMRLWTRRGACGEAGRRRQDGNSRFPLVIFSIVVIPNGVSIDKGKRPLPFQQSIVRFAMVHHRLLHNQKRKHSVFSICATTPVNIKPVGTNVCSWR